MCPRQATARLIRRLLQGCGFALGAWTVPGVIAAAEPRVTTGQINGALFAIAHPETWNRNVLLYAHGLRPETAALSTQFDPSEEAWMHLLTDGWIVAATSYRRNGLIVREAIADLDALRHHIEKTEGAPALVLLLGESMGGTIVTLMAESSMDRYQGAIAIGAALDIREADRPLVPTGAPRIPVIFLSNQSELAGPAAYVAGAADSPVAPALWTISRDGHVNLNQRERIRAIDGLIAWVTSNQIERRCDATMAETNVKSDAVFENGTALGKVRSVTDDFGNVFLSFTPNDFARLGLESGDDFILQAHGREWRVRYGRDYGDVARGAWVAFPHAEGVILLAINHGNAAAAAGLAANDPVTIRSGR
jgi:pimeloyl-ACP methyl ester carboxylesterase